jgi:hypothetical protein
VTVSLPLQQTVQATERFLGQFAAVDSVELRAQVGGTLTGIGFQDGQIEAWQEVSKSAPVVPQGGR